LLDRNLFPQFHYPEAIMADFKIIAKAVALANTDADFKAALLSNPADALAQHGFTAPEGINIHFVDEGAAVPAATSTDVYLQLGKLGSTAMVELDEQALASVAAGGTCDNTASTAFTVPSCVSCFSSKGCLC
jgi:hypothetical protein